MAGRGGLTSALKVSTTSSQRSVPSDCAGAQQRHKTPSEPHTTEFPAMNIFCQTQTNKPRRGNLSEAHIAPIGPNRKATRQH